MPIQLSKYQRFPETDRNDFGLAALQFCRSTRANPKVQSAEYFWADGGNTIGLLIRGEDGVFDFNPTPDPNYFKAAFGLNDLAVMISTETWLDAKGGQDNWEQAGRPRGAS